MATRASSKDAPATLELLQLVEEQRTEIQRLRRLLGVVAERLGYDDVLQELGPEACIATPAARSESVAIPIVSAAAASPTPQQLPPAAPRESAYSPMVSSTAGASTADVLPAKIGDASSSSAIPSAAFDTTPDQPSYNPISSAAFREAP